MAFHRECKRNGLGKAYYRPMSYFSRRRILTTLLKGDELCLVGVGPITPENGVITYHLETPALTVRIRTADQILHTAAAAAAAQQTPRTHSDHPLSIHVLSHLNPTRNQLQPNPNEINTLVVSLVGPTHAPNPMTHSCVCLLYTSPSPRD